MDKHSDSVSELHVLTFTLHPSTHAPFHTCKACMTRKTCLCTHHSQTKPMQGRIPLQGKEQESTAVEEKMQECRRDTNANLGPGGRNTTHCYRHTLATRLGCHHTAAPSNTHVSLAVPGCRTLRGNGSYRTASHRRNQHYTILSGLQSINMY